MIHPDTQAPQSTKTRVVIVDAERSAYYALRQMLEQTPITRLTEEVVEGPEISITSDPVVFRLRQIDAVTPGSKFVPFHLQNRGAHRSRR